MNSSFLANMNVQVCAFVKIKIQKLALCGSFSVSKVNNMVKTSNVPKITGLVNSFKSFNVFPNFHRYDLFKDMTLSMGNKKLFA